MCAEPTDRVRTIGNPADASSTSPDQEPDPSAVPASLDDLDATYVLSRATADPRGFLERAGLNVGILIRCCMYCATVIGAREADGALGGCSDGVCSKCKREHPEYWPEEHGGEA